MDQQQNKILIDLGIAEKKLHANDESYGRIEIGIQHDKITLYLD